MAKPEVRQKIAERTAAAMTPERRERQRNAIPVEMGKFPKPTTFPLSARSRHCAEIHAAMARPEVRAKIAVATRVGIQRARERGVSP